jgi:hypothetical protein
MGVHSLDDLKRKWQHEQMTAEQMIGQMLQHMDMLYDRLRLLEKAHNAERQALPTQQSKTQGAKRPSNR